jgi:hypothetical protein
MDLRFLNQQFLLGRHCSHNPTAEMPKCFVGIAHPTGKPHEKFDVS